MSDWKRAGTVQFGTGVRCKEFTVDGVICQIYCDQQGTEAVSEAVKCIESELDHNNVVYVYAQILRGVYATLGLDIPSEINPDDELTRIAAAIENRARTKVKK